MLVNKNSGQTSFSIDRGVVEAPDQAISRWVVNSYQGTGQGPADSKALP